MIVSKNSSSDTKTFCSNSPKTSRSERNSIIVDNPTSEVGDTANKSKSLLLSPAIPIDDSKNHRRSYDKIRDIGTGSFGKAILVQERNSGKHYVIKLIETSLLGPKERQDTLNEIRVLSSLKHPYIISYKESFIQDDGLLCIVMDYADGGDLYKTISIQKKKDGKGFPENQIIRWFTQATLALKYLHDKHILHRDLKSQNLFLMSNGRLRLGDFGIAKVLDGTTAFTKTQIGTPYYLSPEICKNQPYSWASDIWSLGCILYQLATLHVPFNAPNISVLIEKITRHQPPPLPDHYSVGLRRLYSDCMQRDWQKRPSATTILFKDIIQDEIKKMLSEEQEKRRLSDGRPTDTLPATPPSSQESVVTVTSIASTAAETRDNKTDSIAVKIKQPAAVQKHTSNRTSQESRTCNKRLPSSISQQDPSVRIKINDDSQFLSPPTCTKTNDKIKHRHWGREWNPQLEESNGKINRTPEKTPRLTLGSTRSSSSPELKYGQANKNENDFKEKGTNANRLVSMVRETKRPSSGRHRYLKPPPLSSHSNVSSLDLQNTRSSESNGRTINQSNTLTTSNPSSSYESTNLAKQEDGGALNNDQRNGRSNENQYNNDWKKNGQHTDESTIRKQSIELTPKPPTTKKNLGHTISRGQTYSRRGSLYGVTSNVRNNIAQRCQQQPCNNQANDSNNNDNPNSHDGINQLITVKNTKSYSVPQQSVKSQSQPASSSATTAQTSFNWIKRFQKKK